MPPWGGIPLQMALAVLGVLVVVLGGLLLRARGRAQTLKLDLDAATTRLGDFDGELLPGLAPRPRFDSALEDAALAVDRAGGEFSVLFINLDGFSAINERHGFAAGDAVLRQFAARIVARVGSGRESRAAGAEPQALVTQMNGDEFLVLVPAALALAQTLARRLVDALGKPCEVDGATEQLGCSVGIALYPEHGPWRRLIGRAHAAMRVAKLAGGGAHAVFEPGMETNTREQAELVAELRQAVNRGELELYYQPKIDAASLQITAAEALLRWHHPKRGVIAPGVFIPLAERHGLIGAIGHWVIEDACRQAAVWRQQGLRMRVAINISAFQMREDDLVERLAAALERNGLHPERFTCEITETVAMENTEATRRAFAKMRQLGLHVSIDDFGVGHNSLTHLRQLPAAELKVDASFVNDIEYSRDSHAIVDALVRLAHALGLRVVAEGVETEGQRDVLVRLGCDELQGYLFARPMAAHALGLWALTDGQRGGDAQFRDSLFQDTAFAESLPPDAGRRPD